MAHGYLVWISDPISFTWFKPNHFGVVFVRIMETAPTLPDFALALKPDEYQLPPVHRSWNEDGANRVQNEPSTPASFAAK